MELYGKQHRAYVRGMARELLVHNPTINDVDDALFLAEELLGKTAYREEDDCRSTPTHGDNSDGSSEPH